MVSKNFQKDAPNLWQRIWAQSLPRGNKWQCKQEAMQNCCIRLPDATHLFQKVMPSPSLSLPFSLLFLQFLFCFPIYLRCFLLLVQRFTFYQNYDT
jgi:hypothetical protein